MQRPFRTRPQTRAQIIVDLRALCTSNDKGCWLLPGGPSNKSGHRRVRYQGKSYGAHVFFYEALVGPVPVGLDLDHTCEEPPCVNPSHLDPCTRGENISRYRARRTECKRGHPLEGSNLFVDANGGRQCRVCIKLRTTKFKEKLKCYA